MKIICLIIKKSIRGFALNPLPIQQWKSARYTKIILDIPNIYYDFLKIFLVYYNKYISLKGFNIEYSENLNKKIYKNYKDKSA